MRVIMVAIGTRGDVEPYCALAKELLLHPAQHSVDFVVQSNWAPLVVDTFGDFVCEQDDSSNDKKNLSVHSLPFTNQDFYLAQQQNPSRHHHEDPRMSSVGKVAKIIRHLVLPCWEQLSAIIASRLDEDENDSTILITCSFARQLCLLAAKLHKIPLVMLHLQPLAPNEIFPNYRVSTSNFLKVVLEYDDDNGTKVDNGKGFKETYWKLESALEEFFLKEELHRIYSQAGLEPFTWSELQQILTGQASQYHVINAYSRHLIPSIPNAIEVGPLADTYVPLSFETQSRTYYDNLLNQFLHGNKEESEPPICIGFGSMPLSKMSVILDALEQLNKQVIFVGVPRREQQRQQGSASSRKILFLPNSIPYSYLLPKCSVMMCHGGAGVTQACMAAGIPSWICPAMGDQFLFAGLVHAKGLGVQCCHSLAKLTTNDIISTYPKVMTCRSKCQALANQIQQEQSESVVGPKKLVRVLEQLLARHDQEA